MSNAYVVVGGTPEEAAAKLAEQAKKIQPAASAPAGSDVSADPLTVDFAEMYP